MEKEFVPYELAVKLKGLGFDEECFSVYDTMGFLQDEEEIIQLCLDYIKAPIWQQAFDWFREKHGFYLFEDHRCCCTRDINNIQYWFGIKRTMLAPYGSKVEKGLIEMGCFKTHEEARQACLEKLISLI